MRKIGLIFLSLLTTAGCVAYFVWHQATSIPIEHANTTTDTAKITTERTIQKIEQTLAATQDSNNSQAIKIELNEQEVNDLLVSGILQQTRAEELPEAIKSIDTTINQNGVRSGAIVNLSKIAPDQLGQQEKQILTQVTEKFPALANRDIYIGVEGKPTIKDGEIKLDDHTKIKIGNLSFTATQIANQLEISKEDLEKRINTKLQQANFRPTDIEFTKDGIVFKGLPN